MSAPFGEGCCPCGIAVSPEGKSVFPSVPGLLPEGRSVLPAGQGSSPWGAMFSPRGDDCSLRGDVCVSRGILPKKRRRLRLRSDGGCSRRGGLGAACCFVDHPAAKLPELMAQMGVLAEFADERLGGAARLGVVIAGRRLRKVGRFHPFGLFLRLVGFGLGRGVLLGGEHGDALGEVEALVGFCHGGGGIGRAVDFEDAVAKGALLVFSEFCHSAAEISMKRRRLSVGHGASFFGPVCLGAKAWFSGFAPSGVFSACNIAHR